MKGRHYSCPVITPSGTIASGCRWVNAPPAAADLPLCARYFPLFYARKNGLLVPVYDGLERPRGTGTPTQRLSPFRSGSPECRIEHDWARISLIYWSIIPVNFQLTSITLRRGTPRGRNHRCRRNHALLPVVAVGTGTLSWRC